MGKTPATPHPLWIAVHTKPQAEALAEYHLRRQGYRVLAPWYSVEVIRNRRLGLERRPWFPRYAFVGLDRGHAIAPINSTVGVSTVLHCGDEPLSIPWELVRELIGHLDFDQRIRPPEAEPPPPSPEIGATYRLAGTAFVDKLAVIASEVDQSGKLGVLIGGLRASVEIGAIGARVDSDAG